MNGRAQQTKVRAALPQHHSRAARKDSSKEISSQSADLGSDLFYIKRRLRSKYMGTGEMPNN